jgi:methionyl-tRNA synthetase
MGYGGLNLPTDIPANQFVTFKGDKASASRGVGRPIGWYTDRLEPDALRYALTSVLPEHNDTDLSDDQMIERINSELVATWGNLVNRVLSMTARSCDGSVPVPGDATAADRVLIATVDTALIEEAELIERVELRAGLRRAMEAAGEVNAYLNAEEPWRAIKADRPRAETVLWTAVQAIAGLRVAFAPYLPFSTARLGEMLGVGPEVPGWGRLPVPAGTRFGEVSPLFIKLDEDALIG